MFLFIKKVNFFSQDNDSNYNNKVFNILFLNKIGDNELINSLLKMLTF